jgi:dTDP-4-amino-4,6-dideoxy-D-galactose acyltransferase
MALKKFFPCRILEWDTNFFGFRVAQVNGHRLTQKYVRRIDKWCQKNDVSCLYFLSRSDDARTTRIAEDCNFRMVDIRIALEAEAPDIKVNSMFICKEAKVRYALPEDLNALSVMAQENHLDSRFYYDENIPANLADELYETWIRKSCNGYADAVLVAESNGFPVGYISCNIIKEDYARGPAGNIGLFGVSKMVRGKGIGHMLLVHALDWFAAQSVRKITVISQGRNRAAQRLYQRCGFMTTSVELWYHKWYEIPETGL